MSTSSKIIIGDIKADRELTRFLKWREVLLDGDLAWLNRNPANPLPVVLVCQGGFGDAVMFRSLLSSYVNKYQGEPIVMMHRYREVLLGSKSFSRLIDYPSSGLRHWDFGYLERQGYTVIPVLRKFLVGGSAYLDELSELGRHYFLDAALDLGIEEWIYSDVCFAGIELPSKPFILIHPVSRVGVKNWSYFDRLYERLREEFVDFDLVQVVAKADIELGRAKASVTTYVDLSFRQICYLVSRSELVVGVDSAIGHIAAMLDKPSVTLFGPTRPEVCRPMRNNVAITPKFPVLSCDKGCHSDRCKLFNHSCVDLITVDEVATSIVSILNQQSLF